MPFYDYFCEANQETVEVMHGMNESVSTWGELCALADIEPGETPSDSPVKRLIATPGLAFPKTNAELKNMGFTKLVKREKGVYENVTATGNDKRFMRADDPSSIPDLSLKIND